MLLAFMTGVIVIVAYGASQEGKTKSLDLGRSRLPVVHFGVEKSGPNTILQNIYDQTRYCALAHAAPI
jgi:hypothetical protein